MPACKTSNDAARALSSNELNFRGEIAITCDADIKTLLDFTKAQVRKGKRLRLFVTEHIDPSSTLR